MRDAKTSVALYSVSSDVDGAKIAQQMGTRFQEAIVRMLATAREQLTTDPQLVASMLQGMMIGVSRRMFESSAPEKQLDTLSRGADYCGQRVPRCLFCACYGSGCRHYALLTGSLGLPSCASRSGWPAQSTALSRQNAIKIRRAKSFRIPSRFKSAECPSQLSIKVRR